MATEASRVWKKHGALDYKECVIDDVSPPMVTLTFPKMAKAKPNEAVWFSFITYKSRAHRDRVNAKVMAEMQKRAEQAGAKRGIVALQIHNGGKMEVRFKDLKLEVLK